MFEKWRLTRERERIQSMCDHDWHVIRTYQVDSGKYVTRYDWIDKHDIYCPACERKDFGVSEGVRQRIEGIRKARRLYAMEQRKGDDITWND